MKLNVKQINKLIVSCGETNGNGAPCPISCRDAFVRSFFPNFILDKLTHMDLYTNCNLQEVQYHIIIQLRSSHNSLNHHCKMNIHVFFLIRNLYM